MRNTEWMNDGLCTSYDLTGGIDPWFPTASGNGARAQAKPAIEMCRECPVQVQCLAFARKYRIPHGVFGGVLRNEKTPTNQPWEMLIHGTDAAYTQHLRRREKACQPCLRAHSVAHNKRAGR